MVRKIVLNCLAVALGVAAPLVVAEVALRFLPVNEGLRVQPVNERDPILHFKPGRVAIWSHGWKFDIVNRVRVNNAGFINDQNYDPGQDSPLVTVIGDSYVEAAMVPYESTIHGRLARHVAPVARVYSFGASGASLPQYLAWAEHARDKYQPQAAIFVIISNDFTDSLLKYEKKPAFHYFVEGSYGNLSLHRIDYEPSVLQRFVRQSALAMYLVTNVSIQGALPALDALSRRIRGFERPTYVANTVENQDERFLADAQRAVDAFLTLAPASTGLQPAQILFVLDGMRPHLYDPSSLASVETSFLAKVRSYFMVEARKRGFRFIDMQPVFIHAHQTLKVRFEFPTDGHWSALGHAAASDAVVASGFLAPFLSSCSAVPCRGQPASAEPHSPAFGAASR